MTDIERLKAVMFDPTFMFDGSNGSMIFIRDLFENMIYRELMERREVFYFKVVNYPINDLLVNISQLETDIEFLENLLNHENWGIND